MATGVTSSITSNFSINDKGQLPFTENDDTLIIQGATVTLLAPEGDILTDKGDDTVLVEDSTIKAEASNLAFYLGDGNDAMTVRNSTISAPLFGGKGNDSISIYNSTITTSVETGAGNDSVFINGSIQTSIKLKNSLSFGTGDDMLELVAILENTGSINFGSGGAKTLRFNGGALLGSGTTGAFSDLEVTLSGGTTGTNLTLSGEQTSITLNGNLSGETNNKTISVTGGATTFTVGDNVLTNVRFVLTDNTLVQTDGGILEISGHSGTAITASNSILTLHDIVIDDNSGIWLDQSSICTISNSNFSNSDSITTVVLNGKSKMTGAQLAFSSNHNKGAVAVQEESTLDVTGFRAIGNTKGRATSISASRSGVARTTAFFGGAISQIGGNVNLTSAAFSGNITTAFAYASAYANASATVNASAYVSACGGAIYRENGIMTLTSAAFSGNVASATASSVCNFSDNNSSQYNNASALASATAFGGAICQSGGSAILTSAAFSGNSAWAKAWTYAKSWNYTRNWECASAYGGAIYQSNGDTTMTGAVFSGNHASALAMGYAYGVVAVGAIASASFSASAFGGAVCQIGGQITMTGAVFSGNIASAYASAIASAKTGASASAFTSADAFGGAVYLSGLIANMEDTVFSGNIASASAAGGAARAAARGGAIYVNNATLNYAVTSGKTVSNVGNKAVANVTGVTTYAMGGWLYAVTSATINVTVEDNASLIIGATSKYTDKTSKEDSIAGTSTDSLITKNGTGLMQINSDISEYAGKWKINEGTVHLRRINQTITLDDWTIGTNGKLRLSEENDTINMRQDKKVGFIDLGGGADTINTKGYSLTDGELLISTLRIGGGGQVSVKLTNRRDTAGLSITLNGAVLDSDVNGNQHVDGLAITQESSIGGKIDLAGGDDFITGTAKTTFTNTVQTGSGNDSLTFTDITFEKDVELGEGNNTLKATGTAKFSGALTAGAGDDILNFAAVIFEDAVNLENGDNSLTATGAASFSKALNTGSGNDTLSFTTVSFDDSVNLGEGTNSLTATGTAVLKDITTGSGNDTISLNGISSISGEISLGTGVNRVDVYKKLTATGGIKIVKGGQTTVNVYLDSTLTDNVLSVYADAEAARDIITLNWSEQTDLDKVRILVSSDSSFKTYEFSVGLYNHSKSFTLNLQKGYFIQFQAQDDNAWEQRLLDDSIAPDQVTGVVFNGKTLTWDETHDNLGGNGVKQYHVEVSEDASFTNLIASETVTGTEYALTSLSDSTMYFRVRAEDYTNNIGDWSETVSGVFDETPPGRPGGGSSTVNGYSATLTWSAASDTGSGVARYEYRIAADSDYGQVIAEGSTESCTVTTEELGLGKYYWSVRAIDAAGNVGNWSLSKNFTTVDIVAPSVPMNLDYDTDEQTLVVVWDAASDDPQGSGLSGYEIQLANDAGFGNIVKSVTVNALEAIIEDLSGGTYYMRVCSVDKAGNKSAWTDTESFVIDGGDDPGPGPGPEPEPPTPTSDYLFFTGDFSGDGKALLAVQSGSTVTVYANGQPWGNGLTLDPGWEIAGVGDFNGDGSDDFLRVHTSGLVIGEMSDGTGTFSPQVLNFKSDGWSILGTGNFDGVGADDVLIANPTAASETVGLLGYWKSGTEWTLINGYSPEWTMVSTGDFNGDGKCDMLWKNSFVGEGDLTYNAYCTWIVDDPVDWRMVSVANPDEWNFLCAGDFNGDGANDIAMINDVGVVGIWGVNDGYLSSWSILSAVTPEWQLAGVADFNADGTDDIAWSNTDTGLVGAWQIENKELNSWQTIATIS